MTEHPKKGISGIVMGLVALVIILGVSNAYLYTNMQGQISTLSTDRTNLQNQVTTLTSQKNMLNTTYQTYVSTHNYNDTQYSALKYDRDSLYEIANLQKMQVLINSETITQPAEYYTYWDFDVYYAGYMQVRIEESNSTNNYVEAIYSSLGVEYDEFWPVVAGESAYFPVLPGTVQIRIGTTVLEGSTGKITITLYY